MYQPYGFSDDAPGGFKDSIQDIKNVIDGANSRVRNNE